MQQNEYFTSPIYAVNEFVRQLNDELAAQLKELLENKHLYQKVSVDPEPLEEQIMRHVVGDHRDKVQLEIAKICHNRLTVSSGRSPLLSVTRGTPETVVAALMFPSVRLYCRECKERNVFRPVWYQDAFNELQKPSMRETVEIKGDIWTHQLIFLALQCQHCDGTPEGFLIRREGWRFSLDGRSPMEHIELPAFIPKAEANLFRDAMVAWYAGKRLAAVFYLRSFIEQFARRQTAIKDRRTGDEIMDAYAKTLPEDKRGHLPSLKDWYDKMSEPLHAADENAAEALFDKAREAIESHFDIRRVFKIAEKL